MQGKFRSLDFHSHISCETFESKCVLAYIRLTDLLKLVKTDSLKIGCLFVHYYVPQMSLITICEHLP